MFDWIPKLVEVATETAVKAVVEVVSLPQKCLEAAGEGIDRALEDDER